MCGGERHIKPLAFGRGTIFLSVRQIFISLNAFNNYASYYFRKLNARLFSRADQLPEHRWECILILQKRLCARRMVLVSRRTRSSRNNDPPWMHNPSWSSHGGMSIPYIYHFDADNPASQWQFVPVIRHKFILLHRINGYIVIVLVMISNTGAFLIIRRSFGGTLPTQAAMGLLIILSTTSIAMAYYNIKRLQIEQHRAWMLRAMFYLGVIITTRIIMVIAAQVSTAVGKYYVPMICDEIVFVQDSLAQYNTMYPQCSIADMTVDGMIAVAANFGSDRKEQLQASLELNFGMAAWLSIFLHTIGVEVYLNLTPTEGERLRRVIYAKQLEAGMKNPGSAGLTVDRWGDADEWIVPAEDT